MKSFLCMNHPEIELSYSQVDCKNSMAHPYGDPIFAGSFVAYGPQAVDQHQIFPQIMGLASTRVALPLDLAQDGPIYVNAKQYHGILRRRQSRAKLEAQNKLIKSRKPYLHESRHRHALNRVRGSGGRFLSKKQLAQSNADYVSGGRSGSVPFNKYQEEDPSELERHYSKTGENASSVTTCSDRAFLSGSSVNFRQQEHIFLGTSASMGGAPQCSEGLTFGRSSVVR